MSFHHSPKIVTDGLILCLDAADPKSYNGSGTTWYDRSGRNHDAIIVGPTFVNNYFDFGVNNSSKYMYLKTLNYGGNINVLSETSAMIWMRTSFNNNLNYSDGAYDGSNWALLDFDRSEAFNIYLEGGGQLKFGGSSSDSGGFSQYYDLGAGTQKLFNDNLWHYVGFTFSTSSQKIKFYADGMLLREVTANGNMTALGSRSSSSIRYGIIGDGSEASNENGNRNNLYYDGQIASIHFYDTKALNEEEVLQNYNAQKGRFGLQ